MKEGDESFEEVRSVFLTIFGVAGLLFLAVIVAVVFSVG